MKRLTLWAALLGISGCQGIASIDLLANEGKPPSEVPGATGSNPSSAGAPAAMPSGEAAAPNACEGFAVAAAPSMLRRLSLEEQRNTFSDLLGSKLGQVPELAPLAGATITEQEVDKLSLAAASMVATRAHRSYLPTGCKIDGPTFDDACARQFIADFGRVAFRRPLTDDEANVWLFDKVYKKVKDNTELAPRATFAESIDAVAQVVLQAPQVLYVAERGVADASLPAGVRRLTGHERATRLSYLLWKSTPDTALLAAADSGALETSEGVRAQAQRLVDSPRASSALRGFVTHWLQLDGNSHQSSLESMPKSAARFPLDSPGLRKGMREELVAAYERSFRGPGGSFGDLMTSRKARVNRSLARLYGVPSPPADDNTFADVDLDPTQRSGLFTRAGFLALYTPQDLSSPIRRGVFVLQEALCRPLGSPPANVDNTPLKVTDAPMTVRQLTEVRTAPSTCQGCHSRINPLGYTLDAYDAIGAYQATEKGTFNGSPYELAINTDASVLGTDFDGPVGGPPGLTSKLAQSGFAHDCLAAKWFSTANPRPLTKADACSLQRVMQRFRQTDDMRDLVVSIASEDSALYLQELP